MNVAQYKLKDIEETLNLYIGGYSSAQSALSEVLKILKSNYIISKKVTISDLDNEDVTCELGETLIRYE